MLCNPWQDSAGGDVKTANAMLVDGAGTSKPRVSPVPALAPLRVHAAFTEPLARALFRSHSLSFSSARAKACVCVDLTLLHDWCCVPGTLFAPGRAVVNMLAPTTDCAAGPS